MGKSSEVKQNKINDNDKISYNNIARHIKVIFHNNHLFLFFFYIISGIKESDVVYWILDISMTTKQYQNKNGL